MDGAGTIPVKKRTPLLILSILLNLLLVVASWATVLHYYPLLPEEVPTHYGLQGPPDSWGDKSAIFSVPAVQTGLVTLLLVVSLLMMRYPWMCNFPVDLKTLSDGARDELYSLASDLLIAIGIIVNLLFFYIVLILLCHITDKSTAGGGMISNRLENKTNIKRLNGWLI